MEDGSNFAPLVNEINAAVQHIPVTTPRDFVLSIVDQVAAGHGLTRAQILGPDRKRPLVIARHEAMRAVAAAYPSMSSPCIGRLFNRDHSTVLYALGRIKKRPAKTGGG